MKIGLDATKQTKPFYTPDELADLLAVSKATVYRLVCKRQLPFHKIGGVLRFKREDIEEFLETQRIKPISFQKYECEKKT
jgi:excisionase family DNA binding protein